MQDMFTDPERDLPRERRIVLDQRDPNDFKVQKRDTDPYGLWWISREKGNVPHTLSGAYTTYALAEEAVKQYLASFPIPKTVKEVKDVPLKKS